MVQNLATVMAGLAIAMFANWKLALVVLVILPLMGAQGYAQMRFLKGFSSDAKVSTNWDVSEWLNRSTSFLNFK